MNFKTCNTEAKSTFSDGIIEHHNSILGESTKKIHEDVKCEADVTLAWAVSAKNSLSIVNGFSPNQLGFSFNPNMPILLNDYPPALEYTTML